jgi:FAD/FMN-containing dehydrogenase
MSKFNKILGISEKSIVVEAGVVLDQLNAAVRQFGLEFPVRPGSHAACTIGGMIATNAAGLLAGKFGRTADWLISIKLMDGTGKIFSFEGEEAREFAGTEGCCGIILEAKLKLSDLSNRISSDLFAFDSTTTLIKKVAELKQNPDVVSLEYINKIAAQLVGLGAAEYLIVKYSSLAGKLSVEDAMKIWKLRENLYSLLVEAGYQRIEDPQVPEEHLEKFLPLLEAKNIPCYGHIAAGILHPHFKKNQSVEEMLEFVKSLGGKPAAEHGIGLLKKAYAPFALVQKIKQLKTSYDPHNILNKNKMI